MTGPLSKLVMKSAAKYKVTAEAKALLVCQAVFASLEEILNISRTKLELDIRVAYRKETIFIKTNNSSLTSEVHMRRMVIIEKTRKRLTLPIPCKFIIVQGMKAQAA